MHTYLLKKYRKIELSLNNAILGRKAPLPPLRVKKGLILNNVSAEMSPSIDTLVAFKRRQQKNTNLILDFNKQACTMDVLNERWRVRGGGGGGGGVGG